jgi:hypothetical protein
MSEKDSETFAGMDEAAKAIKAKLESIFSKDDPDEASPEDRGNAKSVTEIAEELVFGEGKGNR